MSDPTGDAIRASQASAAAKATAIDAGLRELEDQADAHRELSTLAYLISLARIEAQRVANELAPERPR